jgi:hypothetical protein
MNMNIAKNPVDWLLEPDDPGVRYLALRDLIEADAKELATAAKLAHSEGQIAQVLAKMKEAGYWEKPGAGYSPKYTGTVWSLILLAQMGGFFKNG